MSILLCLFSSHILLSSKITMILAQCFGFTALFHPYMSNQELLKCILVVLGLTNDLWLQMDGIETKWVFSKISLARMPWHLKSNKDIITKFKRHGFQIIRINKKSLVGVALLLPTFPPSWIRSFLAIFHNTERRDITD